MQNMEALKGVYAQNGEMLQTSVCIWKANVILRNTCNVCFHEETYQLFFRVSFS